MRRGTRQKLDGDGWDWCIKKRRRIYGHQLKRGFGKYVKRKLARRRRRERLPTDDD